jgi:CubicO group peptidase (beta-lactamase class C family)
VVFSKSFGYSDLVKRDSIKENDLFLIASLSKPFVGTAIMQLVEKKKISLDDDVNNYLDYSVRNPRFPQTSITVRMLLCHRSGLKRSSPYKGNFIDLFIKDEKDMLMNMYEDFVPGNGMSYSNMGFDILGAIVEKVTGVRFDEYVDNSILKPLGIYGGYDISRIDTSRFVRTYSYKDGNYRKLSSLYSKETITNYKLGYSINKLWPAGGMVISANDLAKFMIAHMNKGKLTGKKRILSRHGEESLWERQFGTNHGLSFVHFNGILPEVDLIGMSGGARGIHSYMLFEPNEKFGFVVICNGCTSKSVDGSEMNKLIIRELYNAYIDCK